MSSSSPVPPFTSSPSRLPDDDDVEVEEIPQEEIPIDQDAEDEPSGEDLMGDNMERDYVAQPELDRLDGQDLDEQEYEAMTAGQRREAERQMMIRDRRGRRRRRDDLLVDSDEEDDQDRAPRRRILEEQRAAADGEELMEDWNLNQMSGDPRKWLPQEHVQHQIKLRFRSFLHNFTDETNRNVYFHRIQKLASENRQSLEVNYHHLAATDPVISVWLADAPKQMLDLLNQEATNTVKEMFPYYSNIAESVDVRVTDLPVVDTLRELRVSHLRCLVRVTGMVTSRTAVFPQLSLVKYNCDKCGNVLGPFAHKDSRQYPQNCPDCGSKGGFSVNAEQTVYENYQKITIQEAPQDVPAGRLPRHKDVILLRDMIDSVRPGDEVDVTGIYTNTFDVGRDVAAGFPCFGTVIHANFISTKGDAYSSFGLTDEDKAEIRKLSKQPDIAERITRSIAPSIYGHPHIKESVALSLFGGTAKEVNQHRLRGDINVLLLGDPGTAKSQVLRFVSKTAPRAVMATGQGASAVGLTAAVTRDPVTKQFVLQGGALVMADQGVCTIDEFDKMNDADRTSIHEAMEQQSISISKAGIVTSLQARCSVIAAANPIRGRYDSSKPFSQNVDLTEPILSRFDCLCVVRDRVDVVSDERLAEHVVRSHMKSHPLVTEDEQEVTGQKDEGIISHELLRKYIIYARQAVRPQIHIGAQEKLERVYLDLRRESMVGGGMAVGVRHFESIIRMAEARARMCLRDHVRDEDLDVAIRVMLESFITAQKFSVMNVMRRKFGRYLAEKRDHKRLILHELQQLFQEAVIHSARTLAGGHADDGQNVKVSVDELKAKARDLGIFDLTAFLNSTEFTSNNFQLDGDDITRVM